MKAAHRRSAAERCLADLAQPRVAGAHRDIFLRGHWKYVEVDLAQQARNDI